MGNWWRELRYGLGMLANNKGFTAVAILALALGIGPNVAIFTSSGSHSFLRFLIPMPTKWLSSGRRSGANEALRGRMIICNISPTANLRCVAGTAYRVATGDAVSQPTDRGIRQADSAHRQRT